MPNPQWKPDVNKTRFAAVPANFSAAGIPCTFTKITWIEEVSFVLTRIPDRREYALKVYGRATTDDYQALGQGLRDLPIKPLDASGKEIPSRGPDGLSFRGPQAEDGTYHIETTFIFDNRDTRPAYLAVGNKRHELQRR
ncbi:MAG: hypothetical protein AAF581_19010 [Planctomycetota bacterium]